MTENWGRDRPVVASDESETTPLELDPMSTNPSSAGSSASVPASVGGSSSAVPAGSSEAIAIPETLVKGQTLLDGRYVALKELGTGGMGVVWLVQHLFTDELHALKLLKSKGGEHGTPAWERFRREARLLGRFQHPNAVRVIDAKFRDDRAYIIMEYVPGESLDRCIRDRRQFSADWTAQVVYQLCDVLQVAHDQKIVHRDLKPSNVMVIGDPGAGYPKVKLLDLGIAKDLRQGDDGLQTADGSFLGTPMYVSPEQAKGGKVDGRSDLYSLGVIVFELLTGSRPFRGTIPTVLLAHQQEKPPAFSQVRQGLRLPAGLEQLVRRCLEKKPERRPQSALELANDLRALMAQAETAASMTTPGIPMLELAPSESVELEDRPRTSHPTEDFVRRHPAAESPQPGSMELELDAPSREKAPARREDPSALSELDWPEVPDSEPSTDLRGSGSSLEADFEDTGFTADAAFSPSTGSGTAVRPKSASTGGFVHPVPGSSVMAGAARDQEESHTVLELVRPERTPGRLTRRRLMGAAAAGLGLAGFAYGGKQLLDQLGKGQAGAAGVGTRGERELDREAALQRQGFFRSDRAKTTEGGWPDRIFCEIVDGMRGRSAGEGRLTGRIDFQLVQGYYLPEGFGIVNLGDLKDRWPERIYHVVGQGDEQKRVEYVRIPGGTFQMGDFRTTAANLEGNQALPVRTVRLSGFYLQEDEVSIAEAIATFRAAGATQGNWPERFQGLLDDLNQSRHPSDPVAAFPATALSHRQAVEMARGLGGLLPSEAQWEYAARSLGENWEFVREGATEKMVDEWPTVYGQDVNTPTYPTGEWEEDREDVTKQEIRRLSGNAREWCRDVYEDGYRRSSVDLVDPVHGSDQARIGAEERFVVRGSSLAGRPEQAKTYFRSGEKGSQTSQDLGFRVVIEPPSIGPALEADGGATPGGS